jgi:hypothetical protein
MTPVVGNRRLVLVLAVIGALCWTAIGSCVAQSVARGAPSIEAGLLALTNAARVAAGVAPLAVDPELAKVARWRSQDMATRGYFGHLIPPDGETVFEHMTGWDKAGENIATSDQGPDVVQAMFMASPTHRANVLDRDWQTVGIGTFAGADGMTRYTVLFAVPSSYAARASWYCLPGRSRCTRGHAWTELAGAAGPGLPFHVGERVLERYRGRSVVVRLIDRCPTCGAGIDLYASAFRRLAPLSAGRIVVTVGRVP